MSGAGGGEGEEDDREWERVRCDGLCRCRFAPDDLDDGLPVAVPFVVVAAAPAAVVSAAEMGPDVMTAIFSSADSARQRVSLSKLRYVPAGRCL